MSVPRLWMEQTPILGTPRRDGIDVMTALSQSITTTRGKPYGRASKSRGLPMQTHEHHFRDEDCGKQHGLNLPCHGHELRQTTLRKRGSWDL